MAESKLERYIRNLPKVYKAGINPNVTALLKTWASEEDLVSDAIQNTKEQMFVKTAQGPYLTKLAASVGVRKPNELGLLDDDFRQLIPLLSYAPKQIRKTFYDVMRVLYGELYQKANIETLNAAPYDIETGDILTISVDGGPAQSVEVSAEDLAIQGAATAEELALLINKTIKGVTASIIVDSSSGDEKINIRTNTPGARGSIQIMASTMVDPTKVDFPLKKFRITDLEQRTVIYQVRPRELIIELPASVPIFTSGLKGSHHFHEDETLEPPVPPENGIWQGGFLFDPKGDPYTVTSKRCTLDQNIQAGSISTAITVTGADDIEDAPGALIFEWGLDGEEQPVRYLRKLNPSTLLLDPSYVFQKNHSAGAQINQLAPELQALIPRENGDDYAIYFTSPTSAREVIQDMLKDLAAAGVIVKFVILLPDFKYLTVNPYETSNE